jgi:hypothetical protein
MKKLLLLALLAASGANAHLPCPEPHLQVFHQQRQLSLASSPFVPTITLKLAKAASCPEPLTYQFKTADLILVRDKRPLLPTLTVTTSAVDLTAFQHVYQPGDKIYIELHEVTLTSPTGEPTAHRSKVSDALAYTWTLQ